MIATIEIFHSEEDERYSSKKVFIRLATVWKKLKPGMKFVFYQSHEDTGFVVKLR